MGIKNNNMGLLLVTHRLVFISLIFIFVLNILTFRYEILCIIILPVLYKLISFDQFVYLNIN